MRTIITGCAGFIGFHSTLQLLAEGHRIVGIDNLNNYYNQNLKIERLKILLDNDNFSFEKLDLSNKEAVEKVFAAKKPNLVLHLAAQAGVRFSIEDPYTYIDSNILGTATILEGCRHNSVEHLIYASSSSVYGANTKQPFSPDDRTDSPVSLYAATKKSTELLCESYSRMYKIRATGLRFFTVYGPWGRPDMAYFKFAKAILSGTPIDVYNWGKMRRDLTYIDDIVDGISALSNSRTQTARHNIYNLGNNHPIELNRMIEVLEEKLGCKAEKKFLPMQLGDVEATYADITSAKRDFGFSPKVSLEEGLDRFCNWFISHQAFA
ncbi:NAD-dependent epimerase/dehydratase family protein [Hydrogenophaga electricum]|uniref:NAD-dependent epimerase n=1 Tax=Hydrogenophaga electricum TaxID=1230953 RepID=A0ABQ6C6A2_9BURK|nr:NAD-dependent epimerase/dehydratase family protein [Hydrogenophaga electricum]GLS15873.1 NAD-dependent epimerase [Hydrogenophaga electricum]